MTCHDCKWSINGISNVFFLRFWCVPNHSHTLPWQFICYLPRIQWKLIYFVLARKFEVNSENIEDFDHFHYHWTRLRIEKSGTIAMHYNVCQFRQNMFPGAETKIPRIWFDSSLFLCRLVTSRTRLNVKCRHLCRVLPSSNFTCLEICFVSIIFNCCFSPVYAYAAYSVECVYLLLSSIPCKMSCC